MVFVLLMAACVMAFSTQAWGVSGIVGFAALLLLLWMLAFRVKFQNLRRVLSVNRGASAFDVLSVASERITHQQDAMNEVLAGIGEIQRGRTMELDGRLTGKEREAIINLQSAITAMHVNEHNQTWAVRGIAEIAEVRKFHNELSDYAQAILKLLIKHLDANQGLFYVQSGGDTVTLTATYGFDKTKFPPGKTVIAAGQGIVGQSIIDRKAVVLTNVPEGYTMISSGLGAAKPRFVGIFPLMFRENVYGVVELALFRTLESHELEFIHKASETIASEIAASIHAEANAALLRESQSSEQQMREKEDQLLRNMEELKRTQDRLQQHEQELKQQLMQVLVERRKNQAVLEGCIDGVISFGENGRIQFINAAALEIFGYRRSEVIAKPLDKMLDVNIRVADEDRELVSSFGEIIHARTATKGKRKEGAGLSLSVTCTKINIENEFFFTLFIHSADVAQVQL